MLLINSSSRDTVRIFQPFYPIYPPIGIGYLLSALEKDGIRARHIDEQVEDDVLDLAAQYARDMNPPYIFGFSVLTAALKSAIHASRRLKMLYRDSFIIFGGIHPTLVPEEVLSYGHIDAILRDESEVSLAEFYRCIKDGKDFTHIKGLSFRRNSRVIHNDIGHIQLDLDAYPPFPYERFVHIDYDMGFVFGSRGCPYKCIFCSKSMAGSRFCRYRSPQAIVNDLEMLCNRYKKKYAVFIDDNLLVNKKRIYTLIDLIRQKGLNNRMRFSFQARGDNIEYNLCKELYDAGFRVILFGLETASENIMKTIKKGETVAQCIDAVKIVKKIGFSVGATFVYAFPGETHRDRMDCLRLTKELKLDMVRYNNAIPYPGTELYEIAKKEKRLNIQGMYENFIAVAGLTESPFKKVPFAYVPEGNSEDEIRRDILISHLSVYCNIPKTLKVILKPASLAKWFSLGDNICDAIRKFPALFCLGVLLLFKFIQCIYYSLLKKGTALPFRYLLRLLR